MKYVIYNPADGEIVAYGEHPSPTDMGLGTLLTNVEGTTATHYVANSQVVAYSPSQAAAKSTAPSYAARWSNGSFSWVDARTLDQAKAETWETIRIARDANQAMGFAWDGSKFDSDDISVQRIQGALQLALLALSAGQPFSIVWTLYDNTTRTMSAQDMVNMYLALGTFVQSIFTAGVNLRNQINAATSLSQLHNISWVNIS